MSFSHNSRLLIIFLFKLLVKLCLDYNAKFFIFLEFSRMYSI